MLDITLSRSLKVVYDLPATYAQADIYFELRSIVLFSAYIVLQIYYIVLEL